MTGASGPQPVMHQGPRRVVSGLDASGKSTIIIDDRREISYPGAQFVWRCKTSPADNSSNEDTGLGPFDPACVEEREGSSFAIFNLKPEDGLMGFHSTGSINYMVVLEGRLQYHSETGMVEVGAGDVIVDRGMAHDLCAVGNTPAVTAVVMVPAKRC